MFIAQSCFNFGHTTGFILVISVLNRSQFGADALIPNMVLLVIVAQGIEQRAGRNNVGVFKSEIEESELRRAVTSKDIQH